MQKTKCSTFLKMFKASWEWGEVNARIFSKNLLEIAEKLFPRRYRPDIRFYRIRIFKGAEHNGVIIFEIKLQKKIWNSIFHEFFLDLYDRIKNNHTTV